MNVLFTGLYGVPYSKRAADVRLNSFAKLFKKIGCDVTILNKINPKNRDITSTENSDYNIVEVKTLKLFYSIKLLLPLLSYISEIFAIFRLSSKKKIDLIHVYSGHFIDIIFYKLLSKLVSAKVVYQYVEFRTAKGMRGPYHKINNYLVDNYALKFVDGVINISTFLEDHVQKINKKLPTVKIPPICDFKYFKTVKKENESGDYLLFCGSTGYYDVIDLIINSYKTSDLGKNNIKLILILSGSLDRVEKEIENDDNIEVLSNLEYEKLVSFYKGAKALLIPLRDTIEDTARFPNKICEYFASESIIITTNYGEVKYYFEDSKNSFVSESFTVNDYAQKLNLVLSDEAVLSSIRKESMETGRKYFDNYSYEDKLKEFVAKTTNRSI